MSKRPFPGTHYHVKSQDNYIMRQQNSNFCVTLNTPSHYQLSMNALYITRKIIHLMGHSNKLRHFSDPLPCVTHVLKGVFYSIILLLRSTKYFLLYVVHSTHYVGYDFIPEKLF
jgi:hypothetical protein